MRRLLLICFLFFGILAFANVGPVFPIGSTSAPEIQFTENKGQWPGFIKAKAEVSGGEMYLSGNAFCYHFMDFDKLHKITHGGSRDSISSTLLKVTFLNADKGVKPIYSNPYPDHQNYFLGNDPAKWREKVYSYQNIKLANFYPNIDLELTSKGQDLKYDLVAKPNADLNTIAIKYSGQRSIRLVNDILYIETDQTRLVELKPVAYQIINGLRKTITCNYILNNDQINFKIGSLYDPNYSLTIDPQIVFSSYTGSRANNFGFTATYDIDGNTYIGGVVFNSGYLYQIYGQPQADIDQQTTDFPVDSFPASPGAYKTQFQGGISDVVIFKFSKDGKRRQYATYLGGSGTETPHSMVVNSQNQLIIFGATGSADYPVTSVVFVTTGTGSFFQTYADYMVYFNGSQVFTTILNETGTALVASNVIRTNGNSGVNYVFPFNFFPSPPAESYYNYGDHFRGEVICDKNDNIIVATYTYANKIPNETTLKIKPPGDNLDAWVFKLSPDLTQLKFSKRFGGSGTDVAYGLQPDSKGNLFFTGYTNSVDLVGSLTGLNKTITGQLDGYVAKMDSNGNMLACSYLGTAADDQAFFVQTNLTDEVFVMGQTWSNNYPVVSNGISPFYNVDGGSGQFIHKLDNNLTATGFSSVFGSKELGPDISPTAFLVDNCGLIYVSGWRGVLAAPGTPQSGRRLRITETQYNPVNASGFYFGVFEANMQAPSFGTYFGNNSEDHVDGGTSRFDKRGYIHQAICGGCQGNNNTPTTGGVWSVNNSSLGCNMVGVKFDFETVDIKANFTSKPLLKNDTIHITSGQSIEFNFTGQTLTGSNVYWEMFKYPSIKNTFGLSSVPSWKASPPLIPNFMSLRKWRIEVDYAKSVDCIQTDIQTFFVAIDPSITGANICNGDSGQFNIIDNVRSVQWTPFTGLSNPALKNPKVLVSQDTSYTVEAWANDNSYFGRYKVPVKVINYHPKAMFGFSGDSVGTYPLNVTFANQSFPLSSQFIWNMGDAKPVVTTTSPIYTFDKIGRYNIKMKLISDSGSCHSSDSANKYVYVKPKINDIVYCPDSPFGTFTISGGTQCIANINGQTVTGCMPMLTFPGVAPMETSILVSSEPAKPYTYIFTITGKSKGYPIRNSHANFEFLNDSVGFFPLLVALQNQSPSLTDHFLWDMGDGKPIVTATNPTYTFDKIGSYNIKLKVIDDSTGCRFSDSASKYVYVKPTINDIVYCPDNPFGTFTVSGGSRCVTNINGKNVFGCMPTLTFTGIASTETQILVSSDQIPPYIFTITGKSHGYPIRVANANFAFLNDSVGTFPLTVALQNQSVSVTDRLLWDMGDGKPVVTSKNPIYTFDKIGKYDIKLKVIDDSTGCRFSDSVSKSVYVKPKINEITYCPERPYGIFTVSGGFLCIADISGQKVNGCMPVVTFSGLVPTETNVVVFSEQGFPFTITGKASPYPTTLYNYAVDSVKDWNSATVKFIALTKVKTQNWNVGDGKTYTDSIFTVQYDKTGNYPVFISGLDTNNCTYQAANNIDIAFMFIPNVFTPNGDQSNEVFEIRGLKQGTGTLQVFNRWGHKVYESGDNNYKNDWRAENQEDGVYYYNLRLNYRPEKPYKGWVQVIR